MYYDKNKQMIKKSKEHLNLANENYFQHMRFALNISFKLIVAAIMAFMHAFLPLVFTKSASNRIKKLYSFAENRNKN